MSGAELNLFVRCHDSVFAMPSHMVDRLVLSSDLRPFRGGGGAPCVEIDRRSYARYNLAELLGMPPATGAHVLVRIMRGRVEVPICLDVGACLLVTMTSAALPLPKGIFRARPGAITGVVPMGHPAGRDPSKAPTLALALAIPHLLVASELDAAIAGLRPASTTQLSR